MKSIVPIVYDTNGAPVVDAVVILDDIPKPQVEITNESGMCEFIVEETLDDSQITIRTCDKYDPYSKHVNLGQGNRQIRIGMPPDPDRNDIILPALKAFDSGIKKFTREELLKFRGALWIKCNAPWMTRPNQDDNVASTNGLWNYTDEVQDRIISEYKDVRKYTHGPIGPFIDSGYHNLIPGIDFRNDMDRQKVESSLIKLNKAGIITPLFLTPDGWTVEQLRTIEGIYKSDFWQKFGQIVVNGFEQQGDKYGWSNSQYVEYLSWVKEVFPNAVRGLHTVSEIEIPVGKGDDTSKPGMSGNECWGRLNNLIDFWLFQSNAVMNHDHVDPAGDGRTDGEHWLDLWDKNLSGSFVRRFSSSGTWSLAKDIIPIAGEFWAYGMTWDNTDETIGRTYGRVAIERGAHGSFDGCLMNT